MQTGPLHDDQVEELSRSLRTWGGPPLEYVDGLFSALIVGPSLVPLSEYWPALWDGESPDWASEAEAKDAVESLMALWNHIVWRVGQPIPEGPEDPDADLRLLPFLGLPDGPGGDDEAFDDIPDDYPFAGMWAAGFLRGVQFRLEDWANWIEAHEDFAEDLERVSRLAVLGQAHARELGRPEAEVLGFRQRLEQSQYLPQMLEQMNVQRMRDLRPVPARRKASVGRNDPCPCGSGRKYKKCCGGAAALH